MATTPPNPSERVQEPLSRILENFSFLLPKKHGHHPWTGRAARDTFYEMLREELCRGRECGGEPACLTMSRFASRGTITLAWQQLSVCRGVQSLNLPEVGKTRYNGATITIASSSQSHVSALDVIPPRKERISWIPSMIFNFVLQAADCHG